MANIVLVCVGNFQDYIHTNITQLLCLGHNRIFVLISAALFPNFEMYQGNPNVKKIDVES